MRADVAKKMQDESDLQLLVLVFKGKLLAGMMPGDQLDEVSDPVPLIDGRLHEETINWTGNR